jgi:hypothetical protein
LNIIHSFSIEPELFDEYGFCCVLPRYMGLQGVSPVRDEENELEGVTRDG